jgi:hypothetical protein
LASFDGALGLDIARGRIERADGGRDPGPPRLGIGGSGGSGGKPPCGIAGGLISNLKRFDVSTMSRANALVAACKAAYLAWSNSSGCVKSSKSHNKSSSCSRRFSMEAGQQTGQWTTSIVGFPQGHTLLHHHLLEVIAILVDLVVPDQLHFA